MGELESLLQLLRQMHSSRPDPAAGTIQSDEFAASAGAILDDYLGWEQPNQGADFFGEVLNQGPGDPPESDYEDARYWVRETVVHYAAEPDQNAGLIFDNRALLDEIMPIDPETEQPLKPYPLRYVTATNMAEWNSDEQTHSLSTDGKVVVRVHQLIDNFGQMRFWFEHGGVGGSEVQVVARRYEYFPGTTTPDPGSRHVWVQEIQQQIVDGNWTGIYETVGDVKKVTVWPPLTAGYFLPFLWEPADGSVPLNDSVTVLPLTTIKGIPYLKQRPIMEVARIQGPIRDVGCTRGTRGKR
jgi:hypothetical protein